jgi:hypothetical protein
MGNTSVYGHNPHSSIPFDAQAVPLYGQNAEITAKDEAHPRAV